MSDSHQGDEQRRHPEQGSRTGRRRAKILIPLGVLLVVLGLVTYLLLNAQRGAEDDSDIYQNESAAVTALVAHPVLVRA